MKTVFEPERVELRVSRVEHVTIVRTINPQSFPKYDQSIDALEEKTMLFVQRMTSIATSTIYAIYTKPSIKKNYIVMKHVERNTLAARWPSLSMGLG